MMKSIERVKGHTQEYNIITASQEAYHSLIPRRAQEDSCQAYYLYSTFE